MNHKRELNEGLNKRHIKSLLFYAEREIRVEEMTQEIETGRETGLTSTKSSKIPIPNYEQYLISKI